MHSHHVQAIVNANGGLNLERLPFSEGESVEVIVYPTPPILPNGKAYPLRGTVIEFPDATTPIADSDWESIK